MKDYPPFLPLPVRDEYSFKPTATVRRVLMDDGFTRPRRSIAGQQNTISLKWMLHDLGQAEKFSAWWDAVAAQPDSLARIPVISENDPLEVRLAGALPAYEPQGTGWIARATVLQLQEEVAFVDGMLEWPAGLPDIDLAGYNLMSPGNFEVADPTDWQAVGRLRNRSRQSVVTTSMNLTTAERNAFWEFYTKSQSGTRPFMCNILDLRGVHRTRCEFAEEPTESSQSTGFSITFKLQYRWRNAPKLA